MYEFVARADWSLMNIVNVWGTIAIAKWENENGISRCNIYFSYTCVYLFDLRNVFLKRNFPKK